ncbi:DoxX family protein [Peredibacter starrii]|uniref:DoxX family protein n=1 Tax=Peredibacter starrii TaxID=28202 RepID=A0AAX4HSX9_9BACT|nr:DoxX family protein [Peredibacter starrii]WPU66516.1 DoxX family protein [Peredibacter starrii]
MKLTNKIFRSGSHDSFTSTGLLTLRIVAGLAMVLHGTPKLANPTGWLGDSVPALFQFLAVLAEVGGGLAVTVGLLTPVSTFGVVATMVMAVRTHLVAGDPLFRITISNTNAGAGVEYLGLPQWFALGGGNSGWGTGSAELAFLFLIMSATLFFTGAGKYSLDAVINAQNK